MFDLKGKKGLLVLVTLTFLAWVGMMGMLFATQPSPPEAVALDNAFQLVSCDPYSTVIEKVKASVVTLTATGRGPQAAGPDTAPGAMRFDVPWQGASNQRIGCGLVIDPSGYILTNRHIVDGATDIDVRIYGMGEKTYPAKVAATDPAVNLALLKIQPPYPLPTARLGNSDLVEAGDVVMAIGSPFGFEYSVTRGIVSDERRTITVNGQELPDMIQTDAAINRGNNGGPLIDSNGLVVGVNTAILTPSGVYVGLSFAAPINKCKKLLMTAKYSAV